MKATVGESQRTKPGEEARLPTVASHWITRKKAADTQTGLWLCGLSKT